LRVDVRVIASSNKDLEKEIEKGNFREDIYYRLNVIPIEVPCLRNRREDIPLLVETFFAECAKQDRNERKRMNRKAIDMLCNYSWPGNVRELKNLVERLDIMVEKDVINEFDLPAPYNPGPAGGMAPVESELFLNLCLKDAKKAFEREFIKRKLLQHNNNISDTAKAIGVERAYLDKRLKSPNVS